METKSLLLLVQAGLLVAMQASAAPGQVYNVLNYGARGDGQHNDTAAISAALDAARRSGGGEVYLPANYTFRSGSLYMASHTVFRVDGTLLGSPLFDDFPTAMIPAGPVINGVPTGTGVQQRQSLLAGAMCNQTTTDGTACASWQPLINVTVTGTGTIDGNGAVWWYPTDAGDPAASQRPDMVQIAYVDGLTISGVTLRASPAWTVHLLLSNNVHVTNIHVDAGVFFDDLEYLGHNVDGVDPDSCTNVLIENSVIRAGDDCIAVYSMQGPTRNVLMRNLTCYTPLSVTHGKDTRNVTFDNCTVIGQWGNDATQIRPRWFKTATRLKTDRNTNITMSDITFRNIVGVGVDLLIDIQSWYPCHNNSGSYQNYLDCRSHYPVKPGITPLIQNIVWENIQGINAWRSGWVNCLPESPCRNVTITNVQAPGALPYVCENAFGVTSNTNPSATSCVQTN